MGLLDSLKLLPMELLDPDLLDAQALLGGMMLVPKLLLAPVVLETDVLLDALSLVPARVLPGRLEQPADMASGALGAQRWEGEGE